MQKPPLIREISYLCTYHYIFTPNLHGNAKRSSLTAHFMQSNCSENTFLCILFIGCAQCSREITVLHKNQQNRKSKKITLSKIRFGKKTDFCRNGKISDFVS